MFLFFDEESESPHHINLSGAEKVLAGITATVMVPAHGYILQGRGLSAAGSSVTATVCGPFGTWMKTFLGACAWAFMIAAGSLVYTHFVKKWQANGLPMLPVAALGAVGTASFLQPQPGVATQSQTVASAGGLPSGSPTFQRARPAGQTSFLDEFEL